MNTFKRLITFSLIFGVGLSHALAQEAQGLQNTQEAATAQEILSWKDSIRLAQENNPELKAAHDAVKASENRKYAVYGSFLPQINGGLSYSRSDTRFGGSTLGAGSINRGELYSANINGAWNIFSGLNDVSRLKQAEANVDEHKARLQLTKARISYELKEAYQGLWFAKSFFKLTEEITKRREENLRLVELRFESGFENKGSVLLSRANFEQAKYDSLRAANSLKVARVQLARTLGLDEFRSIDISDSIPVDDNLLDITPNIDSVLLSNPDVSLAHAAEEAANHGIGMSRSNFIPKLNVTGSAGQSEVDFFPSDNRMWSFGVSLTVPLFAGGQNYFGIKNASALWSVANRNFENTKRVVRLSIEQAFARYKESIVKLKVDGSFRDATQVRAEIARKRYNNGLLIFDNWIIIEDDLIRSQTTFLSSGRDRVLTEASYERALGRGVIP